MFALSVVLVAVASVTLVLGVVGAGDEPLGYVYGSIVACLLAAVCLAAGVLRSRPSRDPLLAPGQTGASWSGASPPPTDPTRSPGDGPGQPHVQVLTGTSTVSPGAPAWPGAGHDHLPLPPRDPVPQGAFAPAGEGMAGTATTGAGTSGAGTAGAGAGGAGAGGGIAAGDVTAEDAAEDARFAAALRGLVDPVRTERLRGRFADLDGLRAADVDAIAAVPGVPRELAERIHARLRDPAG